MNDLSYMRWAEMSDQALLKHIGNYVKHHRLTQNRSQGEVSQKAGISRSTLSLLERGEKTNLGSFIQVLRVLDLLPVLNAFTVSNEISPVEYAKLQRKQRRRASKSQEPPAPDYTW